ncbi:MAG: class I SAM-dependent methyltransferase [Acidimicrobiia bacterium]
MGTRRIADFVRDLLGDALPISVEAYDGSRILAIDSTATLVIRSPDAIPRILYAPGELGLGRAYVAGDLDVEGDIFAALSLRDRLPDLHLRPHHLADLARLAGKEHLRPIPPPAEEARLHGRRHSPDRDAAAIAHHYDVSNRFYDIVLGPSLTYSCAVFSSPDDTLEQAQANKYELISRKLDLRPGMRLLDVGCGWGGMVLHAAAHHGVSAVGITVSKAQAERANQRIAAAGLADRAEVRVQDYREVTDGPFDAVSSIGMFEHVGKAHLAEYFDKLRSLLRPQGRLLNHGISRPRPGRSRLGRRSFVDRYVFPDGELHEVGSTVTALHEAGFEVRHLENLREHYALTLRRWVANLERHWDEAVAEVGAPRARIWRLYMAASALNFEANRNQIHQALAVATTRGASGMPLRPRFDLLTPFEPTPAGDGRATVRI